MDNEEQQKVSEAIIQALMVASSAGVKNSRWSKLFDAAEQALLDCRNSSNYTRARAALRSISAEADELRKKGYAKNTERD